MRTLPPSPLILVAPLTGRLVPLGEVPDPVFAGGMVGDGVAIDPEEGRLVAPCRARVAIIAEGGHGFGLATDSGLEILLHVGIDTVELKGQGFAVLVSPGDEVESGQPLAGFDLGLIRAAGKLTVSPVVIANREHVEKLEFHASGLVEAGKDPIMKVWPKR